MGQLTDAFLSSQGITPKNPAIGIQPADVIDTESDRG